MRLLGKQVYLHRYREFESRPLRFVNIWMEPWLSLSKAKEKLLGSDVSFTGNASSNLAVTEYSDSTVGGIFVLADSKNLSRGDGDL